MNLSERLNAANGGGEPDKRAGAQGAAAPDLFAAGRPAAPGSARRNTIPEAQLGAPVDALGQLKERAGKALYERLGSRLNDATLSVEQLHALVREELATVVDQEDVPLTPEERQRLFLASRPGMAPGTTGTM